ncbi:GNAT family N-acetyltransferase [Actinomadura sp. ATCC 31491]|uniref:GNAT family N-acetyltransferase n=1 Tax=Actinomadura luzonensis TaxID=2805427 RepID=A0ABT0FZC2_9ACTN|nr:GNAT family N-acetyltransferase [Actinomadura luzonensis]MCK2217619.1 GNAT family N-acetyltransferase [Actinomadura luzonensis]
MTTGHVLRPARPDDYDAIAAVVDSWWGRPVLPSLPRLFLDHFHRTSLIASTPEPTTSLSEPTTSPPGPASLSESGEMTGFLIGFLSPSAEHEAYIHFVGVSPRARGAGLARTLYETFFDLARKHDRSVVKAITSPLNTTSIAFHQRMGFTVQGPLPAYNGPGTTLMTFERPLT